MKFSLVSIISLVVIGCGEENLINIIGNQLSCILYSNKRRGYVGVIHPTDD